MTIFQHKQLFTYEFLGLGHPKCPPNSTLHKDRGLMPQNCTGLKIYVPSCTAEHASAIVQTIDIWRLHVSVWRVRCGWVCYLYQLLKESLNLVTYEKRHCIHVTNMSLWCNKHEAMTCIKRFTTWMHFSRDQWAYTQTVTHWCVLLWLSKGWFHQHLSVSSVSLVLRQFNYFTSASEVK